MKHLKFITQTFGNINSSTFNLIYFEKAFCELKGCIESVDRLNKVFLNFLKIHFRKSLFLLLTSCS